MARFCGEEVVCEEPVANKSIFGDSVTEMTGVKEKAGDEIKPDLLELAPRRVAYGQIV